MTEARPAVALLALTGDARPYDEALREAGGAPLLIAPDASLPQGVSGLCVAGQGPFGAVDEPVPESLSTALDEGLPVLAIEAGMHALNLALGGGPPTPSGGHIDPDKKGPVEPVKLRLFLAPGGKVADAIGGAGFVMVSTAHTHGLDGRAQAPELMATAHSLEDGVIMALERPGSSWQIGVQWRQQMPVEQPSGFARLTQAFVRRAANS